MTKMKAPYDQLAEATLDHFVPDEQTKRGGRVFRVSGKKLSTQEFRDHMKERIPDLNKVKDITIETKISKTLIAVGHRLKEGGPRRPHRRMMTEPPAKPLTMPSRKSEGAPKKAPLTPESEFAPDLKSRELKTFEIPCGPHTSIRFEAYEEPQNVRSVETKPISVASRSFSPSK